MGRFLKHFQERKQKGLAKESIYVFLKLLNYLGIDFIRHEMKWNVQK